MPCTKINQIYFPYYVKSNCQTFEGYHKDTKHSDCAKNKFLLHVSPYIFPRITLCSLPQRRRLSLVEVKPGQLTT